MPTYLSVVHGLDIKQLGGALFAMFFAGFVGELIGGQIGDAWRARGGQPNTVFRTLFGIAAIIACLSIFGVAYFSDPLTVVILLSSTLFFLRWCGMYWAIPRTTGLTGAVRLSRRLHEPWRQHRGHHSSDHRRLHSASDRVVLCGPDVPCLRGGRSVRSLDAESTIAASWRSEAPPTKFEPQWEMEVPEATRLGMLTPSSNTVLEPMTTSMLSDLPNVTAHFSRFKVTEIAIAQSSDQQFAEDEILRAADLLAHARVNVIAWNGTSASWLGFERDEQLGEPHRRRDRSCRLHLGPGVPGNLPAYRGFARWAGHALCRRCADENNRQLARVRRALFGRAPLWSSRQFRIRRGL